MKDPPSGRVPGRAPERFLVATEACGGGTPDLSLYSMVLGYIGLYRSGGARGFHETGGRALWGGGAPYLLGYSRIF